MSTLQKILGASAIFAVVATSPALVPVADAAGFGAAGFHAGMGAGSGFHGGFRGGGTRGFNRMGDLRGHQHDWHHYGYWQNGAWIGISPGYYDDAYNQAWDYYCDPDSPYFDPDVCNDQ